MNMLECVLNTIPVMEDIFQDEDAMIVVSDLDEIVYYRPGTTIDLGYKGLKLASGDGLYEAIQKQETLRILVPKEIRGVPFKAITVPLFDERNQILGVFGVGWSLDVKNKLYEQLNDVVESLASYVENISSGINDITNNAQDISASQKDMVTSADVTKKSVEETTKITDFIKNIANQTNLLGLNAAIEASRAGQEGRGFQVVAGEIRKLAVNSKEAVSQIESSLKNMQESINFIINKIENTSFKTQSQATASEEINLSIQELSSLSDVLLKITKELEIK